MNVWIMKILSDEDSRAILKRGQNGLCELSGLYFGSEVDDIHQLKTVSVTVKISSFSIHCFTQLFGSVKYLILELVLLCIEPVQKHANT